MGFSPDESHAERSTHAGHADDESIPEVPGIDVVYGELLPRPTRAGEARRPVITAPRGRG